MKYFVLNSALVQRSLRNRDCRIQVVVTAMMSLLLVSQGCAAGIDWNSTDNTKPKYTSAPPAQCGVYAVYGALAALKLPVSIEPLIAPEYIGSAYGSTINELSCAVRDSGASACAMKSLSVEDLYASEQPMILHVSSVMEFGQYRHWVVFLGLDNDAKIRLFDPAHGATTCSAADLLARWDGVAIAVSKTPQNGFIISLPSHINLAASCLAIAAIFFGIRQLPGPLVSGLAKYRSWLKGNVRTGLTGFGIVISAFVIWRHVLASDGFYKNKATLRAIANSLDVDFTQRVSSDVWAKECLTNNMTIVDARYEVDYQAGHIANAISVPINSTEQARRQALKLVRRTAPVLIYCQSDKCDFADRVATQLYSDGFEKIRILNDGWIGWEKNMKRSESGKAL